MKCISRMMTALLAAALLIVMTAASAFAAESGVDWSDQKITVQGMGVAPANARTAAQARMLARRAAVVDGYRQIAEIVKGVNVFPSQIETVLLEQGYTSNYQIVVDRVNNSDTLDVLVEMTPDHFSDSLAEITKREKGLVAALKAMLGIFAQVHLVSPKSIARSEGKAIRVIDKRKI